MLDRLRLLDPGRTRLRNAARTLLAALAALLVTAAVCRAADLPGGVVVIATVVAVMLSRSLHDTSLTHRLSALLYVPAIGVLAGFVGRFMLHHAWLGSATYVAAVGTSRYLMRFGGTVRRLGRLALAPLISVMVVPIPPSAAEAAGPLWGAAASVIAVACLLLAQAALPARPAREAATAALDLVRAAHRLPSRRALTALHRAALTTEDRLAAAHPLPPARLPFSFSARKAPTTREPQPPASPPAPFAALSAAVIHAEVLACAALPPPSATPELAPASAPAAPAAPPAPLLAVPAPAAPNSVAADSAPAPAVPTPAAPGHAPAAHAPATPAAPGHAPAAHAPATPGPLRAPAPPAKDLLSATPDIESAPTTNGGVAPAPAPAGGGVAPASAPAGGGVAAIPHPAGSGTPDPAGGESALARALAGVAVAAAAVRGVRARELPAAEPARPARSTRRGPQPQTRLSAQLAVAMAAAFAAGHLLFPHHWTWTVITAFVVCSAARARGDVVHRSGLRIGGAFAGAVTGTLAAHLVAGTAPLAVAVIFCYLFVGLWLRDVNYAVWAFCVTSLLAVMYSLNGEHDTASLLLQRPEGILLGSACGILAAFFVLPLPTETVMRGRAARTLQVLQDLLAAAREPAPDPAALRHLARAADRAARDLTDAAASARAHRALFGRGKAVPHAADWADTLALCVGEARALAATPPHELAVARAPLGLTALNLAQVRRRLGRRPEAEPPRPVTAPPPLRRLNTELAALYHQLPAPA